MNTRAWLALVVPPSTWALHGAACYWSTVDLCGAGFATSARVVVAVLTIVALAVAVSGGVCGYSELVRARRASAAARSTVIQPAAKTRAEYVGFAGVLCALLFSIGIVLAGLPMLLLNDVCGSVR